MPCVTFKLFENFEAVKPKLKSKILKLKNIRDKCPQRKEKMRPPLDFHAEGKNVVNFWQIVTKQEAMESFAFPYKIKMILHLKLFSLKKITKTFI